MNIVLYARFSSHSQNEQSIEGQLKTCYEFAERNDYKIIEEYIDRSLSGTNNNRPEFQRMIADSAKRQFQAVIVYQLDRFARNRYDSATYKAKLKKNGVKVLSARENITDDANGVLMEAVLEGMAEYYSVELSQKIKRGIRLNAEKCLYNGSGLSLGYAVDENKRYILDTEKAPIVKKIFEMYLDGSTMAEIIRYLNDNQIKTMKGNIYDKNSVRRVLTNKPYCGIYVYEDIEIPGGMPRMIDDKTFANVQVQLEKNKKAPARAKAVEDSHKAFEAGKATDVISGQIEKRQAEKSELEVQLAKERLQGPQLEYNNVKFFFERFAKGDPKNTEYRRSLVDIFIGRIELGKNKLRIHCNVQEGQTIEIPIGDSSPMGKL